MSVKFTIECTDIALEILITIDGYKLAIIKPKPKICPVKAPEEVLSLVELKKVNRIRCFYIDQV